MQRCELSIAATDLETTMMVKLRPDLMEGEGEVTIPARLLLEMKTFADVRLLLMLQWIR